MRSFVRSSRSLSRRGQGGTRFAMLRPILPALVLGVSGCAAGPTVVLPQDHPIVRTGPDVTGRVYVWDGEAWTLSANRMRLPEGWYVGPLE